MSADEADVPTESVSEPGTPFWNGSPAKIQNQHNANDFSVKYKQIQSVWNAIDFYPVNRLVLHEFTNLC